MYKDDGWFIRHVEPPNACRPCDNPTGRLAIGVCASKYVRIDPVCERVALSARSLQKSSMSASARRTSLYAKGSRQAPRPPRIDARTERRIREALTKGDRSILRIAASLSVGSGTVQRVKAALLSAA